MAVTVIVTVPLVGLVGTAVRLLIVGGVLSIFGTFTVTLQVFPAGSVKVTVSIVLML